MSESSRVLVIVPAWNEQRNIASTVAEIRATVPHDIIVVDDGSTDATAATARDAGAIVLSLPFNLGVGGAMRAGFVYARRHGYGVVIQVDADGQHNPADIERVIAGLTDADISIGARFSDVGDYHVSGPRWWAMRFLSWVLTRLTGTRLTDVTSGFRAANSRAIDQYVHYYPAEYLGDTIDSLVAAIHSGLRVTQVPVAMRQRVHGLPSQNSIGAAIYLGRSVFALGLALIRRPRVAQLERVA